MRDDFPGQSPDQLLNSINEALKTMPPFEPQDIQVPLSYARKAGAGMELYAEFFERTKELPGDAIVVLKAADASLSLLVDDEGHLLSYA